MRHTAAHVLAAASQQLKPETRLGVGPSTEDGFFHDVDVDDNWTDEDLPKLEKKMEEIKKMDLPIKQREVSTDDARELFKDDPYKLELIDEVAGDKVGVSDMGEGFFVTLCEGGHTKSTGDIGHFKLTHLSGVYWRGDEKKPQLQRIFGVQFPTKKELDEHLKLLAEAKKRDHRKLGKKLDLFFLTDLVGQGLPIWTERGASIRRELERFIVDEEIKRGYKHVITPDLARTKLYETSGHYPYYKDSMYPVMKVDDDELVLRPMACPHHFMVFSHKLRSYRDLPLRIAELAKYYRYEQSGELSGLIRVRAFCLADSHIFCRKDQVADEIYKALQLIEDVASVLGLKKGEDYWFRLSLGDRNNKDKYYDAPAKWEEGEVLLAAVLKKFVGDFEEVKDDAAFYGPKIDIQMRNVNGKEDTAFTVQYDFCLPNRFKLEYVAENGKKEEPIVIHRSSVGAIERTIAFLIEHYSGALPLWLSPTQVMVLPISDEQNKYGQKVLAELQKKNIRAEIDERGESIGKKIRDAEIMKVPVMLVVGKKEVEKGEVSVRDRDGDKGSVALSEVIKDIVDKINRKE